ncbi:hypothetical protein Vretimale_7665 [Volvox reticuliferus]|uniref:Uncharacterized protein n=1 Tax=Volvox reticuliferus TaxID=1737510 RepID=A0A8J4CB26_9CHLO|nr:hypothetical protein Vretifemale_7754 [Volvox reticuliferus]GIM02829.1 hypothetical protein Vretimale_7665 [Volvox reticuliferus]
MRAGSAGCTGPGRRRAWRRSGGSRHPGEAGSWDRGSVPLGPGLCRLGRAVRAASGPRVSTAMAERPEQPAGPSSRAMAAPKRWPPYHVSAAVAERAERPSGSRRSLMVS